MLLGDSGYLCKKWLVTPFLRQANTVELRYKKARKKTRVGVEQKIVEWKRRFVIRHSEVRLDSEYLANVVLSTCALHNLAVKLRMPKPEEELEFEDAQPEPEIYQGRQMIGIEERNRIVRVFCMTLAAVAVYVVRRLDRSVE